MSTVYAVAGMSCGHCVSSITAEVGQVAGAEGVEVNLESRTVTVHGQTDDDAVRAAIEEAGYEVLATAGP